MTAHIKLGKKTLCRLGEDELPFEAFLAVNREIKDMGCSLGTYAQAQMAADRLNEYTNRGANKLHEKFRAVHGNCDQRERFSGVDPVTAEQPAE